MEIYSDPTQHGCRKCWPDDADGAWAAMASLPIRTELVSESHLMIKLRVCVDCEQLFLSIFTETVDWANGEDPQFWRVLPVTVTEAKTLTADVELYAAIGALPTGRRGLCRDFPSNAEPHCYWSHGISVGRHD